MAYDPSLREDVLFGGYDPLVHADGDTWTFANDTWTNVSSTLSASPPPIWGDSMSYDPALGGVLLFGGRDVNQFFNFTWLFNSTGWWNISGSVGPSPRIVMAMDYDAPDGYLIGFGGSLDTGFGWTSYNDTWELSSGAWARVSPRHGTAPPSVPYGAGTWDATDGYFLVFGGGAIGTCGTTSVTWSYRGGAWTNQTPNSSIYPPTPGGSSAMTFDPLNHSVLLFGGYPPSPSCGVPLNQTWSYQGGHWSNLTSGLNTTPAARCCAAMVFDPLEPGLVMFGGNGSPLLPGRLNDTWLFEGEGGMSVRVTHDLADVGQTVVFNATTVGLSGVHSWNWSYGDGVTAVNASPNVSHTFSTQGRYLVIANATDANGTVWQGWVYVQVFPALAAAPSVGPPIADAPAVIHFRANATGGVPPLTYLWNFSDGSRSNLSLGTYASAVPGNYTVSFTVRDASGWARFGNASFRVYPALGLVTSVTPLVGLLPLNVTATANFTGGDPPVLSAWNFSGPFGGVTRSPVANHTYRFRGQYGVSFTGVDATGRTVGANYTVVALAPLHAYANVSQDAGVAPFTAYLAGTVAGGGGTFTYVWNFSDGSLNGSGASPIHTFADAGTYDVTMRATDQYGFTSNSSVTIYVVTPLTIGVQSNVTIGVAPQNVSFSLTSSGGFGPLDALWSFGDGGSTHANSSVSHVFRIAGTYSITVTATDVVGEVAHAGLSVRLVNRLSATLALEPNVSEVGRPVALIAIASYGLAPYEFLWGGLPSDCPVGNVTRATCNSTEPGTYPVWVRVTDVLGERVNNSRALVLTSIAAVVPPAQNSTPANPPTSVNLTYVVAAAAVVLLAAGGALYWWRNRGRGPPPEKPGPATPAATPVPEPEFEGAAAYYTPPDDPS